MLSALDDCIIHRPVLLKFTHHTDPNNQSTWCANQGKHYVANASIQPHI